MNEEKNIETCLPENILAEVANCPTDPQFRSLVNESLDPLKQQAAAQAGWDAYEKVVWTHRPYTFTSSVKQMKSNLILLLRRLWRFPFGRGAIRSLSDMWAHYIPRLQGSETYGIPSRLSSLTDLPSAPLLVADRKISGVPEAADGMSMVHLMHSAYAITELTDNNTGWVLTKSITNTAYPSLNKLHLGCKDAMYGVGSYAISGLTLDDFSMDEVEQFSGISLTANQDTLRMPKLKKAGSLGNDDIIHVDGCKVLDLPEFDVFNYVGNATAISGDSLEQILMPKFRGVLSSAGWLGIIRECANLWKVVWGKIAYAMTWGNNNKPNFNNCPKLIHLEFGQDIAISINITMWNPSYVLSDNPTGTDLIEEGSTAQNNLQQFLQNFRDYIALRLTDNGSGLTLTLSQDVRNAIHAAEDEYGIENIIITQKGWTISPAPN